MRLVGNLLGLRFPEDFVIYGESRKKVKRNLERWRPALERRGLRIGLSRTEHKVT